MASDMAQRFMDALQTIENEGEAGAVVELFAEDASLKRLSQREAYEGRDGARQFWQEYLATFQRLETTFHNVVEAGAQVVLEWESAGTLPGGSPLHYSGVSILEFDGDKVGNFRTYYDSAAFLKEGASR